jgi:hypothetical protein
MAQARGGTRELRTRDVIVSLAAQAEMVRKAVEEGIALGDDEVERLKKARASISEVLLRRGVR